MPSFFANISLLLAAKRTNYNFKAAFVTINPSLKWTSYRTDSRKQKNFALPKLIEVFADKKCPKMRYPEN